MPTNTSELDPLILASLAVTNPNTFITDMESAGQQQIAGSITELPSEGTSGEDRANWESLGFVFKEPSDDPLFVPVSSPTGWKVVPTIHSMHSEIMDDCGRVRGGLFYKATFYDRRASCHLKRRYNHTPVYPKDTPDESYYAVIDQTTGDEIWASESFGRRDWTADDRARKSAQKWLRSNFPDSNDPLAYWDAK